MQIKTERKNTNKNRLKILDFQTMYWKKILETDKGIHLSYFNQNVCLLSVHKLMQTSLPTQGDDLSA